MASSKKKNKKKVEAPVKYEGSVLGNAFKNTLTGKESQRADVWGTILANPVGRLVGNIVDESEKKRELSKSTSQIKQEKQSEKVINKAQSKFDDSYNKLNEYKKQKGINLLNESKFKNDKTYQSLLKQAQTDHENKDQTFIKEKTKTQKFEKGPVGAIEKGEYALARGFETGIQGLESTTQKILGQTPETPKTTMFESMDQKARETTKSKVGQMSLDVLGSIGQMIPQMAVGNPAGAMATGFGNYGGSAYNEAKRNGASEKQATTYGIVSGSTEMLMEKLLGGFENIYGKKMGKTFTDNVMSKFIKNKAVKQTLSNMKGEFTEEYLQQFLEPILKNIILDEKNGADFWNTMKDDLGEGLKQLSKQFFNKENLQAGFEGMATAGIMEGPRNLALSKQGIDVETGRTKNSQSVFDNEVNERIKEAEKDGKKLSNKEKSKIEQEVKEDLENGQIGIDRIESSLGGETYNKYKELKDKITSLQEEQKTLKNKSIQEATLGDSERLRQIESEISQLDDSSLKQQLSDEVRELTKDDELLQRSYIEKDNKSKEFVYEGTDNDTDITKAIIESTKGKLNNTKKAHNLVDALIKIGNDRGIAYKLTNSEELKQMGLSQEGKTTNGVYVADNGEIYVNLDSKNYLEQILVHETTHTLEKANAYEDLQRLTKDFSEKLGTYEKIRQEIEENYDEKDWDSETTARILEDNLGNEDFIRELTNQKPSVVQKIIDTIKYLKKQFSTSSAEARKLNKLQYQMEQAYKKAYNENNITNTTDNKFSLNSDYKSKKLDSIVMDKYSKNQKEHMAVFDENNFYYINNTDYGEYDIIDVIPISGNEEKIKALQKEMNSYESKREIDSSYIDGSEDGQRSDNLYNAEIKWERELLKQIDEFNKEYGENRNNRRKNNEGSRKNNKYSVSNNEELDNSSFSFKQKQYDIIQENNPKDESLGDHTWINSVDDIKTYQEALENDDYEGGELTPDFTEDMLNKALETNKMIVYSSYPIKQGIFITPSKMEAESYAGSGKVYSKEINLTDVAWIDSLQGQYAKVENQNVSSKDNTGRELSKKQQEYFKDSKARDENGNLEVVYHGSKSAGFTTFSTKDNVSFYTNNENVSQTYSGSKEKVDTKKLESLSDAKSWLKGINDSVTIEKNNGRYGSEYANKEYVLIDNDVDVNEIGDELIGGFENEEQLLRGLKQQIQRVYGDTTSGGIYKGYVNIKNPLIIEGENNRWSQIPIDNIPINNVKELLKDQYYREKGKLRTSTNDIVRLAKENGNYDGVIFKNIIDEGMFDSGNNQENSSVVYATFNPNQFKAVDNLNPTEDPDIRYSKGDIAPVKRKGTLGKEVKLENQTINKDNIAPIKGEVVYSLNQDEKNELDGLKALDESGIANNEELKRLKELKKKEKVPKKIEKARENYVEDKLEEAIRKQSHKNINLATKTAQRYLDFNAEERKQFKNSLIDLSRKTKEELTNAKSWNEVKNIVNQFANKEYNYYDNELKSMKSTIRNTKINIPDEVKKQITDYSDFRKNSKLNISKNGQNIDSVWQELSTNYPYLFSNDIEAEADMLYALSDFMNKDIKITEKYKIPDSDLKQATTKVYNKLVNNALTQEDITSLEKDLDTKAERRTRQVVQNELLNKMGLKIEDISKGNDINSIEIQRTDPKRLNEKIFGYETGKKVNDATVNFVSSQEAKSNRWKNKERAEIKALGIKPRSKESSAVQKYGEKKYVNKFGEVVEYTDADLEREFSNPETRKKIKKASEVLRKKYDNYIDKINTSLVEMGYDPIPKRQDYFRHFYEINDKLSEWGVPFNRNDMNSDVLPTDINGLTDEFKPGKNWFANAMERKGMKTTYDAITGIDGYLESASNLIFHTESIQRYRTLSKFIRENFGAEHGLDNIDSLDEKEFNQRLSDIQNNKLSKYVAWLDEQANALAGKKGAIDRSMERFFGRKVYKALNTLKSQVGSNMTGFNVRSAMTNFASAIQGASKTNKLAFIKGTLSTLNNIVQNDGMIDKSDFLTNRFGSDTLSKKAWQKISNAGQIFMTGTDYFTSNQIWRSKYYENIAKGMNETEAIKNADDFASRIMGDRSKGQTAEIFNSKTLGLLTQFQLEVNNQWSSMIHDNKMDIKSGNKSGAMVVFQLGQLFGASYLFNNLMKSLTGSDVMFDPIDMLKDIFKPDKDDDKSLEERTREALGKIVNQLPFASIFTGGRIPISEAFKGGTTGLKYATGQTNKYGQKYKLEDVKDDFLDSIAYWILPTGYGQARKTAKGLSMYDDKLPVKGSYTKSGNLRFSADDTIQERIKTSLFGQYASKNAQDYIDSGYKSINKSKLDEMKDLKMNSTDYRKYRKDLSEAGTKKAEKLDFINKLDISNKKKNIMASNVMKRDIDMKEYNKYKSYEEFDYAYKNPDKYRMITTITDYEKYKEISKNISDIKADVDRKGNTISGSRMKKVINYVNSLNLSAVQKAMIIKQEYPSFTKYDNQIAQHINKQNLNFVQKAKILKGLGFKSYDTQIIDYVKNNYKSIEEQIEILKDMGFKTYTYNGKTYVKR